MTTSEQSAHPRNETGIPRPLGYWVKHIHNRLEHNLAAQLREFSLDRREWQVLNTVAHGPIDADGINRALEPFFITDEAAAASHTTALSERGLMLRDQAGRYLLTSAGEALHGRAADRIHDGRLATTRGITPEEYAQLLDLLRRVSENVDVVAAQWA
ncbi:hypothetical protein KO481_25180 [Nocardia sp. NEAU-G5]|uniref:MarR family transcriptional regulator n=1 Tax=Nocardia albiluteola TaxID=2842303 RepID=A0ABS6B3J3_9NOCA|nr:hypothetical protein [Nocardia albiluteola]MBU3064809.1 hypothetical protein [Nocardia albiluteola]